MNGAWFALWLLIPIAAAVIIIMRPGRSDEFNGVRKRDRAMEALGRLHERQARE